MTAKPRQPQRATEILDAPPPSDVQAERCYVGAAILSREVLEQHPVNPEDFHTEGLGRLCEALQTYPIDGPIQAEALLAWLPPGDLEAIGGRAALVECIESVGHVGHAALFAQRICTAAAKRRIITRLCDGLRHAYNGDGDVGALIAELTASLESIGDGQTVERFHLLSMAELDSTDFSVDYVVEGVLATGEPCIVGGMYKTLKTSIALDLLLSMGTGINFLSQFPVLRTARAVYFLGEGRGQFGQNVCRRIAQQKGIDLAEVENVHLCNDLPNLDHGGELHEVGRAVKRHRAEFAFFDPLYLGLGQSGEHASNVFVIGQRLAAVQRTCQSAGATPIIVHHLRKGRIETDPATLTDLAQAGAAEFAGQWILLNRTRPYDEAAPGVHEFRLSVGSRLGHSSAWGLHVEEGTSGILCGRVWRPEVAPWVEAVKAEREARDEGREVAQREIVERHKDQILQAVAMFGTAGETQSGIRAAAGLSGARFTVALAELIRERAVEPCEIQKANRKAPYQGYRLGE